MNVPLRSRALIAVFFAISIATLLGAASTSSIRSADFTVHEWGTFTSVAGIDGAPLDWNALGCRDDLPRFVNDFGYRGFKLQLRGTVRMETPVMYFYSPREIDAHVKVAFPGGVITEWYPQAETEIYQTPTDRTGLRLRRLDKSLTGFDTSLRNMTGAIEWGRVRVAPGSTPQFPIEDQPSRYYAARSTDAAPLSVANEHEKFLFYRGIGRFPIPLHARETAEGRIVVENRGGDSVPTVMLFENRAGRLGFQNAGTVEDHVTLDRPALDRSFEQLQVALENALVEQGLFPKEAHAMVETWSDSWFEDGARLFYVLPTKAVDQFLPLQIDPLPSRTTRVFVGRIELLTAETRRAVEDALAAHDHATIDRYARFLDPLLKDLTPDRRLAARQMSEVRRRLDRECGSDGARLSESR